MTVKKVGIQTHCASDGTIKSTGINGGLYENVDDTKRGVGIFSTHVSCMFYFSVSRHTLLLYIIIILYYIIPLTFICIYHTVYLFMNVCACVFVRTFVRV